MGNNTTPSPEGKRNHKFNDIRDSAEEVIDDITRRKKAEILGPEDFYLLDKDTLELIRRPMDELGLPIEDQPVVMYDYDPEFSYHIYRVPLAEGYLALIYLRNQVTVVYQPSNNLSQILDWATGVPANLGLEIQAICFFSDGEKIDRPFRSMAESWVLQNRVRFADFVEKSVIDRLLRTDDPEVRRITLAGIFERRELTPRTVQPIVETPISTERQSPNTIDDLDNDPLNKNKLVNIFRDYFSESLPAISVKIQASNLIDSTEWPDAWKQNRKSALTDDAETDARYLVEYAIDRGYFEPPSGRQTALRNLIQRMQPSLGEEDRQFIGNLIQNFNL